MIFQVEQKKKCIIAAVTRSFSPPFLGPILLAGIVQTALITLLLPSDSLICQVLNCQSELDDTLCSTQSDFSPCALNSISIALRRENAFGIFWLYETEHVRLGFHNLDFSVDAQTAPVSCNYCLLISLRSLAPVLPEVLASFSGSRKEKVTLPALLHYPRNKKLFVVRFYCNSSLYGLSLFRVKCS